jgi:hypothetical protein
VLIEGASWSPTAVLMARPKGGQAAEAIRGIATKRETATSTNRGDAKRDPVGMVADLLPG